MAAFTDAVHDALADALAERLPGFDWTTEERVRRTPVDVAGETADRRVFVEVEMRRADPANNPVKLARYADAGDFDRPVFLVQAFSDYYALDTGGVSSKRANAEFVGALADDHVPGFAYRALDLPLAPPKHGEYAEEWRPAVDALADELVELV
ncbi:hypothetical protein [Salarchaeum sp. JOR-1]|uniref:hypothetical protein n=1 Tax=Salarchaeum sp. JOR-1 TaxID=2599399 RepID=UPI0011984CD4|nr:hypothetical protein [Salarchaeum sp. JOR-1]QDX40096.1 hypothetical protein FQU85_04015 [Salarchaeum sp. JOR-1]